jgi:hypothetical protein
MLELVKTKMKPCGKPDRKSRLHVSLSTESENRICPKPEWNADDKVWDVWKKKQIAAQKEVIESCILPLFGEGVKANFSQKAGCLCGCSPGFILTGHTGQDIWIDLK